MNIYDAKAIFVATVNRLNKIKDFSWVDEFVYSDGEIEYQLRDSVNNEFRSILVRYCDNTTHCYRKFYYEPNSDIYDLFYVALSEETAEALCEESGIE